MSSIESASETESDRYSSVNEEYPIEVEASDCVLELDESPTIDNSLEPYADEPLADEEWIANYKKEKEEKDQLENELNQRLENAVRVQDWCTCGNCSLEFAINISECYCCKEIEGCCEALSSEIVQDDLEEGQELNCITDHPGFRPVCLEKWSLRLASGKYRTKAKQAYKKTGSEERYLRAIAYREFTRLVYGYLGKKRIPLPACAYSAIRTTFKSDEDEESAGFQLGEFD